MFLYYDATLLGRRQTTLIQVDWINLCVNSLLMFYILQGMRRSVRKWEQGRCLTPDMIATKMVTRKARGSKKVGNWPMSFLSFGRRTSMAISRGPTSCISLVRGVAGGRNSIPRLYGRDPAPMLRALEQGETVQNLASRCSVCQRWSTGHYRGPTDLEFSQVSIPKV